MMVAVTAVDDLARTRLLRRGFLLEYVTLGWNVAGLALTLFICHVGYEVTADELGRLAAGELSRLPPEAGSFTWTTRAAPV